MQCWASSLRWCFFGASSATSSSLRPTCCFEVIFDGHRRAPAEPMGIASVELVPARNGTMYQIEPEESGMRSHGSLRDWILSVSRLLTVPMYAPDRKAVSYGLMGTGRGTCHFHRFETNRWEGGTNRANKCGVAPAQATYNTAEVTTLKTSLTPCILDDDQGQLDVLAAQIVDMGYETIATADPEEALRLVRSGRCRLVLAYAHMPGMDGYEFLDRALRCDPGLHIIVTAEEDTQDSALGAIRRRATDLLHKPIDGIRLKRTLDEVAALYDQRRRAPGLKEQFLRAVQFHGVVGK